jgi:ADP-ribose pyrophosphatase
MPKKVQVTKVEKVKKSAATKPEKAKLDRRKSLKTGDGKKTGAASIESAQVLSSKVVYQGPLFRVTQDRIIEPGGTERVRDVVRHNGSVVILAVDNSKSKKDPWIVMERQYRHAAGQYLWELPAGKLDAGEEAVAGAQRELEEETGYRAKKWKPLMEYYASPGFMGETMAVFVAEGLMPGDAHPEEDEQIELRLVKMSEVLKTIERGGIVDGKTISSVMLYARKLDRRRGK